MGVQQPQGKIRSHLRETAPRTVESGWAFSLPIHSDFRDSREHACPAEAAIEAREALAPPLSYRPELRLRPRRARATRQPRTYPARRLCLAAGSAELSALLLPLSRRAAGRWRFLPDASRRPAAPPAKRAGRPRTAGEGGRWGPGARTGWDRARRWGRGLSCAGPPPLPRGTASFLSAKDRLERPARRAGLASCHAMCKVHNTGGPSRA